MRSQGIEEEKEGKRFRNEYIDDEFNCVSGFAEDNEHWILIDFENYEPKQTSKRKRNNNKKYNRSFIRFNLHISIFIGMFILHKS